MRVVVAALVVFGTLIGAMPREARACGGLFCNATVPPGEPGPIRIVQDGERVLFAKTPDGVTMIVEVRYDGQPTSFAWLLPIPGLPDGMDLDDALGVSVPEVFTTLQNATDPRFVVSQQIGAGPQECSSNSGGGFGCGDSGADASPGGIVNEGNDGAIAEVPGENPYVQITDSARVGAYDAIHIEATNADALFTWLGQNGYFQDPQARPLLEEYIEDGWSFIGLKLQNGADNGDIRPVVLRVGENAPCVPLRLTRIAANDGMPIFVWVLGPGRAIPKNYVHAVINDQAVSFPNGPDYVDRVADAVDTASGHAWVTELATSARDFDDLLGIESETVRIQVEVGGIVAVLPPSAFGPTLARIGREELVRPERVSAASWAADNFWDVGFDEAYVHDFETLRARVIAEVLEPLAEVDALIEGATTMTRLFTMQDAAEMTKDPIFGFNASLPMVTNQHLVVAASGTDKSCNPIWEVTYANGEVVRYSGTEAGQSGFAARAGVDPLLRVEVLDEEGPAQPFDATQAVDVDRALDGATLGIPSIPSGFELKRPRDPNARERLDPGCNVSIPGLWLFLPMLVLLVRRLRTSH